MESIDLYELQSLVALSLEDRFPQSVWVRAEVASVQARANGHCYLELCQNEGDTLVAKAKAIIWKGVYAPLAEYYRQSTGSPISVGHQILAKVRVNYSELYGLSLIISEIEPQFTLGAAELERRRTIEKLSSEGLMDLQSSLEVTGLPYRLAVISARDAAGYGDFCHHLEENGYGFKFDVRLFEALMQGADAPESIIDALEAVQTSQEPFDAVLIIRGGGSSLDLACFDDYSLCFSIARCPIPVYTAIGHDRDMHVADMVAYRHVKTPTALSDEFIGALQIEDEMISSYISRLRTAFLSKISSMEAGVEALVSGIVSSDPRNVLKRGYSLVTDSSGRVLKKGEGIRSGDRITIMFSDGSLSAVVDSVKING